MWQPIETAPKTTRYILVYDPTEDGGIYMAFWYKGWKMAYNLENELEPTHWMPLPARPSKEDSCPTCSDEIPGCDKCIGS